MNRLVHSGFSSEESFLFPNIINVEVFRGACPCSCCHCPVGRVAPDKREERFGKGAINLEIFKQIVKEMQQFPHATLRLHSVGEPLLWDDIIPALDLAWDHKIKTWVFTSGVTKDLDRLRALIDKTSIIEVSVNSIDAEGYRNSKGVDAFETVCHNIEYMQEYIKKTNSSTRLLVSRVQSERQEDNAFLEYWKGLTHDAFIRSYHTYNDIIGDLSRETLLTRHEPCLVHWARFNINIRGQAVVCFNELFRSQLHPGLILGDISRESIAAIWQSDKLNAIRHAEITGDYSGLSFYDILPCPTCLFCQPLNGQNQTSEHQVEKISC